MCEQGSESVKSRKEIQSGDECKSVVYDWHCRFAQRLQRSRR